MGPSSLYRHACAGPNCSIPRETLLACGLYDEQLLARRLEDIELGLRLWKIGVPFRYLPNAKTYHLSVKSARDVVREDAREDGRSLVALCRKHPDFRPYSPLGGLTLGAGWKRLARTVVARLPVSPDPLLGVAYAAAKLFSSRSWGRRVGVRLLQARRGVETLRSGIREVGSWRAFKAEFAMRLPALLYHHIGDVQTTAYPELTLTPERFERQVRWLAHQGYRGIRPSDWLVWRREGKPLPDKPVLMTFDDAYADLVKHAFPILERYGFGAAVYVVTSQIGGTNAWDEGTGWGPHPLMDAAQIRHWAARGIEFGAHSRTHPDLTKLGAAELVEEVAGSARELAEVLGTRVVSFAYPFGFFNEAVSECAEKWFDLGLTCEEGLNEISTHPLLLRRVMIRPAESHVGFILRARLGWNPIQRLRERLRPRARLRRTVQRFRAANR